MAEGPTETQRQSIVGGGGRGVGEINLPGDICSVDLESVPEG